MSAKDYERFAAVIRARLSDQRTNAFDVSACAVIFAGIASRDNERFDSRRFYRACGLDSHGAPTLDPPR